MSTVHVPTGTVTFVFTDIEQSTEMVRRLGTEYAGLLKTHNQLIRGAFDPVDGVEVSNEGDGFLYVFESAINAVRAAVDAQRALIHHDWPEEGDLRVRMGIHTGLGTVGAGDYVGIDVHRAARIGSCGHGGQVLISETTEVLCRHDLPDDVGLLDLGEYQFKGIGETERVHQIVAPDLPKSFPPLRSVGHVHHNLPVGLPSFVGRQREIADIADRLEMHRLVTLVGIGGTGKTRLALEAVRHRLDQYPDGVWFVDLASISHPDLVAGEVASMLRIRRILADVDTLEQVVDYLRHREVLLVLDNCEHVAQACATLARRLIHDAPAVVLMATSRVPLKVPGESVLVVDALPIPETVDAPAEVLASFDSVALFLERSREAETGFSLTAANAAAVAEIAISLDGIPLAIELAAARIRVLTPTEIAERLDDRFRLLRGPASLERHQTLRAIIDWSYQLLSEGERELFASLSVFRGGFEFDAAAAISGGEEFDTLDGVTQLVDQSLVVVSVGRKDRSRYRLLETLRQYAFEKLMHSPHSEGVQHGHADFFLALTRRASAEFSGPEQSTWLARLEEEHDNVRAAIDWLLKAERAADVQTMCAALGWFWFVHRHMSEGRDRLEAALDAGGTSASRADALRVSGFLASTQGDYDLAEERLQDALTLYEQQRNDYGAAVAVHDLGMTAVYAGDHRSAAVRLEDARSRFEALDDGWGIAWTDYFLGRVAVAREHSAMAIGLFEHALDTFRMAGDTFYIAWSLAHLGGLYSKGDDLDAAEHSYLEARELFDSLADRAGLAFVLAGLGVVAARRGNQQRAAELYREIQGHLAQSADVSAALAGMQLDARSIDLLRDAVGEAPTT